MKKMTRAELAQEKRNTLLRYKSLIGLSVDLSYARQWIKWAVEDEQKCMSLLIKISELQHAINNISHEFKESQKK